MMFLAGVHWAYFASVIAWVQGALLRFFKAADNMAIAKRLSVSSD